VSYPLSPPTVTCFVPGICSSITSALRRSVGFEHLGAPPWAVVAAPVPLDLLLLWYVLRKPRKMAVAYVSIWAIYIVIHILLSALLRYDSLIPAWRLHS
jgi:hypothetical protein